MFLSTLLKKKSNWKRISFDKLKANDKIRVAVGFNSIKSMGIVKQRITDYVWIDIVDSNGKVVHTFTASKSYCKFEKFVK